MRALVLFGGLLLLSESCPAQQQITVSWATKQPQNTPISVNQATPVKIVVTGVNDLLYVYDGYITAAPQPLPDALTTLATESAARVLSQQCTDVTNTLNAIGKGMSSWQLNAWVDSSGKPIAAGGTPNSVSLTTSQQFYQNEIANKFSPITAASAASCGLSNTWNEINLFVQDWTSRLTRPHTYTINQTLIPLNDYTIHLVEYAYDEKHNLTMTNACSQNGKASECTIQYSPQNDLISVSGGFLLSQLQSRTYNRAMVPGQTDSVLQVDGLGSVNPLLVTLVNVKLPCFWNARYVPPCSPNSDQWGWAFSIGPALKLTSSNNQTSPVGLFAGISLHAWKYLYITPGVHVAGFADFPPGFSHNGQDVPSSFTGQLTPQTRTSVRFAISVTFRGFKIPTGSSTSQGKNLTQSNTK